ncbi:MAG: SprT-like domain-containing protein [Chthoniobacteraceae bacterium]|nr:SprT-like domain-containing protein [Chthoniobacteraceae bacterium]
MVRLVHLVKSMVGGVVAPLFSRQADPRRGNLGPAEGRTTPPALPQEEFTEAVLEASARQLLTAVGCRALARMVRVRWNRRLRTTAGLANYAHWTISLNPKVVPFGMEEVDRTLRHELAHLLARYRAGRRRIQPHGAEWRQACTDLGLDGEKRCHELPLPRRCVSRKVIYRCRHCHAEVRRVRPFRRAVACLKCCRAFNRGRYDERYRFELISRQG